MSGTKNIIQKFAPISLNEMDAVKMMNRIDTKYLLTKKVLYKVLDMVVDSYFILTMDAQRQFLYHSLYYDTHSDEMYRAHHNGKLNRYKIRFRRYIQTDDTFLEIKYKYKGVRTIKNRIAVKNIERRLSTNSLSFIAEHCPFNTKHLQPAIYTDFQRITLVNKLLNERVTIDTNLEFHSDNKEKYRLSNCSVIELKRDGKTNQSPLRDALQFFGVQTSGMSKYCLGRAMIDSSVKNNIFKEKMLTINKIENDKLYYRNITD